MICPLDSVCLGAVSVVSCTLRPAVVHAEHHEPLVVPAASETVYKIKLRCACGQISDT